jgi:hypothetical protein
MGKTGTTQWVQVKGVSGQIRLVPQQDGQYKKPGPNQRFKSGSTIRRVMRESQDDRGGRGRRPARGRGRGRGRGDENIDKRVRRRIKRNMKYVMGAKQSSRR